MTRARQWIRSFFDPQPDPAFAQRMDDARRYGVLTSLDARSGTRETRRRIDTMYDRTVVVNPKTKRKERES